jgi:hypothetical protein
MPLMVTMNWLIKAKPKLVIDATATIERVVDEILRQSPRAGQGAGITVSIWPPAPMRAFIALRRATRRTRIISTCP